MVQYVEAVNFIHTIQVFGTHDINLVVVVFSVTKKKQKNVTQMYLLEMSL